MPPHVINYLPDTTQYLGSIAPRTPEVEYLEASEARYVGILPSTKRKKKKKKKREKQLYSRFAIFRRHNAFVAGDTSK